MGVSRYNAERRRLNSGLTPHLSVCSETQRDWLILMSGFAGVSLARGAKRVPMSGDAARTGQEGAPYATINHPDCVAAPIRIKPLVYPANISAMYLFVPAGACRISCQISSPHSAATSVAPCPRA